MQQLLSLHQVPRLESKVLGRVNKEGPQVAITWHSGQRVSDSGLSGRLLEGKHKCSCGIAIQGKKQSF